ncbi:hypothetical protein Bpfe_023093 [Biomphalaria pfeifferi]|uniref:Uncharacterized protein n=1 Tax=Biomphalaria pfeifferi TaxID=112525 RepID=A0AAD8F224_BIOPF|nr:hypothetical protein Bpfe_023093 [Biomphalaria pfeifferi]
MTLIKCGYHCSLLKCINNIFQNSSKQPLLHQPTTWRCRISIFSFRKKSFYQHLRTPGYNHTSKRFLKTDQAAEKEGAKLPLKYKVLLVSSGVLAVGYYCVHTATHSDVPAKPWQMCTQIM